jgi:hypothetical protein
MLPAGIETHNLGMRAAVDLCLRPRGNWDRRLGTLVVTIVYFHPGKASGKEFEKKNRGGEKNSHVPQNNVKFSVFLKR